MLSQFTSGGRSAPAGSSSAAQLHTTSVGRELVAVLRGNAGPQRDAVAHAVRRDLEAIGEHRVEARHVLHGPAVDLDDHVAQQLIIELHMHIPVHDRAPGGDAGELVGVVAGGEAQRRHDDGALIDGGTAGEDVFSAMIPTPVASSSRA